MLRIESQCSCSVHVSFLDLIPTLTHSRNVTPTAAAASAARTPATDETCMTIHTHDPGHMHPCQSPHTAGVGDAERGVGDDVGGGGSSGEAAAALPMLLAIIFMP